MSSRRPCTPPTAGPWAIQGIFWDESERQRAENRLQQQNVRLQEMARSEREAHEALRIAQGRMVQSEKLISLGQMITGVAHEINNPLSYVTNNVAVLERDLGDVQELLALYRQAEQAVIAARPDLGEQLHTLREESDLDYILENLPGLLTRTRDGLKRIHQIVTDLRIFARIDERERQRGRSRTGHRVDHQHHSRLRQEKERADRPGPDAPVSGPVFRREDQPGGDEPALQRDRCLFGRWPGDHPHMAGRAWRLHRGGRYGQRHRSGDPRRGSSTRSSPPSRPVRGLAWD